MQSSASPGLWSISMINPYFLSLNRGSYLWSGRYYIIFFYFSSTLDGLVRVVVVGSSFLAGAASSIYNMNYILYTFILLASSDVVIIAEWCLLSPYWLGCCSKDIYDSPYLSEMIEDSPKPYLSASFLDWRALTLLVVLNWTVFFSWTFFSSGLMWAG